MSDIADSDKDLVDAVRQGSREAASRLAERHLRAARAIAIAVTADIESAEDVCQDAMVYAFERIDDCRDGASFGPWLRQIVRSHGKNHMRRERIRRTEQLPETTTVGDSDSPFLAAERANLRDRMLAALATLSEERREVVLLHDLEGWTHVEIANRMSLPAGTVRSHLHFARRALREQLRNIREE